MEQNINLEFITKILLTEILNVTRNASKDVLVQAIPNVVIVKISFTLTTTRRFEVVIITFEHRLL